MRRFSRLTVAALAALGVLSVPATASPVTAVDAAGAGQGLTVSGDGDVVVTYGGASGAHDKQLFLVNPDGEDVLLFDSETSVVGDTVNVGALGAGTDLVFRLTVTAGWGEVFDLYTGAAELNPFGLANARALTMGSALAMISFEDQARGGDMNFADFGFTVEGATAGPVLANPVPGAAVLMLTALGGAAGWRRLRG